MAKQVSGECHLCGAVGPLSFEHVPPKKAFNDQSVVKMDFRASIDLGPDDPLRGTTQQQGMGGYTLCRQCNNMTGGWYARRFIEWCYQGMELLRRSGGKPTLYYPYTIAPLAVIKQIVMMFFSVNPPGLAHKQPALREFVLNKEKRYLDPTYRFYIYYNIDGRLRTMPFASSMQVGMGRAILLSEVNYPPFGYVFTIDSPDAPDPRLIDITHFARYEWGRTATLQLRLATLPTHLGIPGDYRTKKEIYEQAAATQREMEQRRTA